MPIDPITGQEVIEPTQPPVEVPTAEQPATPEATPSATPEAPLFDSASIEGGTYQGNIPTAIQKLTEAGITNPNEQQITDFFKLGGYYQVARDIERAIKYPDQILSADGKPGKLEAESFAERSALPTVGTAATANSYWDQNRGVQVFAPIGSYFELYPGGGVKKVKGQVPVAGLTPNSPGGDDAPNNSNFNQGYTGSNEAGNKKAVAGFKQETLGYKPIEGKTIAETGRSVFNPTTGVDEYANGDEVLIKYTDGTVERRKVGANPGESVDVNQFGRTPQELGIDRNTGIKNEDGTQKPIDRSQVGEQGGNGLAMSSDLEVIGTEYTSASGEKRKAPKGQVFMQDPKTRKILLRPENQAQYGQESTSQSILAARQKVEKAVQKYIPDADFTQVEQDFQDNPMKAFGDMYTKLQEAQGITTIKQEIETAQKEQKDLDDSYAEKVQDINENPYYSEAQRSRKLASETDKYEMKRSQLTARLQLSNTLLQEARQEAQFIASNALQQYNADRAYNLQELQYEAQRADAKADAAYKLAVFEQGKAEFAMSSNLDIAKFQENVRQFGLTYALDQQKAAQSGSGGGSLFERLLGAVDLTPEQKLQAVYSQLGIPTPAGTVNGKPLSGDAAKVLSIATTIEPEIEKLKEAFNNDYRGSLFGITSGTNRDLVKLVDNIADKIGRLRSGGAINVDEANRFKKQIASSADLLFGSKEGAIDALNGLLEESSSVRASIQGGSVDSDPLDIGDLLKDNGSVSLGTDPKKLAEAIAKQESGGRYDAVSPVNKNGLRAYGKYQVLASNIPSWTKEVLGYAMNPLQFLNDPKAQEAVGLSKISQYLKQYGNPADVAAVWFSGRPLANNTSKDITGTSVPKYVQNILRNLS